MRRRPDVAGRDPSARPEFDRRALPAARRQGLPARRRAVELYAGHTAVGRIEALTGAHRRQMYRLLDRCLRIHEDGRLRGFRALVRYARVADYDIAQTGIRFDNVDEDLAGKPLQWNPGDIGRFMVFFGPISSLFDITTFALPFAYFAWLVGILFGYCVLTTVMKRLYIRRFGWQ